MLSITEIEQINQKLNPELALSLSLDNAKRMESSLLHSGFSPSTDMWKLILFYNGSLEEIKEMISFSFIPLSCCFNSFMPAEPTMSPTAKIFILYFRPFLILNLKLEKELHFIVLFHIVYTSKMCNQMVLMFLAYHSQFHKFQL